MAGDNKPQLDVTLRFFLGRVVGSGAGADFFGVEKALGFKERHRASRIAFVFEVREASFIELER